MQIQPMALKDLRPNEKNPRSIKDGRFADLKRALSEDPEMLQARPVIALPDGTVIAGNMRLRAAEALGWEDIPTIVVELDAQRAQMWALRDNVAYGEWVEQDLAEILFELGQEGADLGLTGLDEKELTRLLESAGGGLTVDEEDPDPPKDPITKSGDIWILGDHRLLCGDAKDSSSLDALMATQPVQMIFTDPPYGMKLDTRYSGMHTGLHAVGDYPKVVGDDVAFDPTTLLEHFDDVTEQFWWGADYYRARLPEGGSWVVWDKRFNESDMNLDDLLGSHFELCWSRKAHKREIARVLWAGHHGMQGEDTKSRVHPTQKPVSLVTWFFDRWGSPGDVVLDPHLGSGSTLIAAHKTGRRLYGLEIDPGYCDVAVQRWEEFTGQKAERV